MPLIYKTVVRILLTLQIEQFLANWRIFSYAPSTCSVCDVKQRWQEQIIRRNTWQTCLDFYELLEPVSDLGSPRKVPIPVPMPALVRSSYSRITFIKSRPLYKRTLIERLDKSYCLRSSVLLRKQTNTGTTTAQTAEIHWPTLTRIRPLSWIVTSA